MRLEALPGTGWDNLNNKNMGYVADMSYNTCRVTPDGNFLIPDNVLTIPLKLSQVSTSPPPPPSQALADNARKGGRFCSKSSEIGRTIQTLSYGGQFLEFCSTSLSTCQTCMKLTRKSTEFCQFFCRHYPQRPTPPPPCTSILILSKGCWPVYFFI